MSKNKYKRTVPSTEIDVYDVLVAFNVTNPATAHAIKKLLAPGQRGSKDAITDLMEAGQSIERAVQLEKAEKKDIGFFESAQRRIDGKKPMVEVESDEAQKVVDRMTAQVSRTNLTREEKTLLAARKAS
jgi:CRISPR/Cas system CMR subunit Cmr4 (Cas7 group RAMP superfamily)